MSRIIVVGAGHNGLVAAAYLAKAGHDVTVLERRHVVGGACVTEELIPGARFSSCAYVNSSLRPQIIRDLELERHSLEMYTTDVMNFVMGEDGDHFFVWPEIDRTIKELERIGERDVDRFIEFGIRFRRFAKLVEPYLLAEPPSLSELIGAFENAGEIELWHEFVTGSVDSMLRRYFSHDLVSGLFTFFALVSVYAGPMDPGTAYGFSHHSWGEYDGEFGRFGFARGGMGAISDAIASAAREAGAVIRTNAEVEEIVTRGGRVRGVRSGGELLAADVVVSSADTKHTYLHLLGPDAVDASVRDKVESLDFRGSMARVHLLVNELPRYRGLPPGLGPQHRGFTLLGGTRSAYEKAWDAQKRGELCAGYPIELLIPSATDPSVAPSGMHTISTGIQQLPFTLAEGDWDSRKDEFTRTVIDSLARYVPNLPDSIVGTYTITPLDLERDYGLTGGNIFQGAMSLNQLFSSRPAPGLGGYETPVPGLYMCGAATHPGGAVMGACGHNAAQAVIADLAGTPRPRVTARNAGGRLDIVDRLASHPGLKRLRNWSMRQKSLRGVVKVGKRM
ncbi:phytoene desaturase family protein [Actinomadura madurae]|uniref:phytoene desaturase family protein n=1 Tax=Actinomadura madurae TaxID=1993 RepID=UPI0020D245F2|nr:NAD(P)/FAD-dependent oxidoreductase [Actinomadura madurae]MCP9951050.1 NAD(P)/FAD-dependent oxidoreductase [Actinomadura madurae]MCP9967833.1 NAD(P)/FAD-dependent oxidoreductase [Actinomadura madurae]MCP9980287.1 NAD(P)/FAD-dependent oxidoreductase [Actinomadura madurae]MCQ0008195.1 NAD(P)/FAD-dependent oxidoreductase [Actinomadura madurae]